jgi:hypothetical protein
LFFNNNLTLSIMRDFIIKLGGHLYTQKNVAESSEEK